MFNYSAVNLKIRNVRSQSGTLTQSCLVGSQFPFLQMRLVIELSSGNVKFFLHDIVQVLGRRIFDRIIETSEKRSFD